VPARILQSTVPPLSLPPFLSLPTCPSTLLEQAPPRPSALPEMKTLHPAAGFSDQVQRAAPRWTRPVACAVSHHGRHCRPTIACPGERRRERERERESVGVSRKRASFGVDSFSGSAFSGLPVYSDIRIMASLSLSLSLTFSFFLIADFPSPPSSRDSKALARDFSARIKVGNLPTCSQLRAG